MFWSLYVTVPLRTLLLVLVASLFYTEMTRRADKSATTSGGSNDFSRFPLKSG
jgi:hypothetical protein